MRSYVPLALVALLLLGGLVVAEDAAPPIQPGGRIVPSAGQCTLGFAFTDGAATYLSTAAHCVQLGERVGDWGTVAWRGNPDGTDFALIRVDAEDAARVDPRVLGWGGPTGVADAAATPAGRALGVYGHGTPFGWTQPTQARVGALTGGGQWSYWGHGPVFFGDSGAPVVDLETGAAVGLVKGPGPQASTMAGPHVAWLLARVAQDGFTLALMTAPFERPLP